MAVAIGVGEVIVVAVEVGEIIVIAAVVVGGVIV